jgi:hypothetical protein
MGRKLLGTSLRKLARTLAQDLSPRIRAEEHFAIGRHRGLAAGGVVGQDGHHVAAMAPNSSLS